MKLISFKARIAVTNNSKSGDNPIPNIVGMREVYCHLPKIKALVSMNMARSIPRMIITRQSNLSGLLIQFKFLFWKDIIIKIIEIYMTSPKLATNMRRVVERVEKLIYRG